MQKNMNLTINNIKTDNKKILIISDFELSHVWKYLHQNYGHFHLQSLSNVVYRNGKITEMNQYDPLIIEDGRYDRWDCNPDGSEYYLGNQDLDDDYYYYETINISDNLKSDSQEDLLASFVETADYVISENLSKEFNDELFALVEKLGKKCFAFCHGASGEFNLQIQLDLIKEITIGGER